MTNYDDLAMKLKGAALNATKGKWSYARSGFNSIVQAPVNMVRGGASRVMVCALKRAGWRGEISTAHDAIFIAVANPDNILALLAERDADKKLISEQRDYIDALENRLKQVSDDRDLLEARTVSVKLPAVYDLVGDCDGNGNLNEAEMAASSDGIYARVSDLVAAGIKLEVGE